LKTVCGRVPTPIDFTRELTRHAVKVIGLAGRNLEQFMMIVTFISATGHRHPLSETANPEWMCINFPMPG